jgi:hypothetical protein
MSLAPGFMLTCAGKIQHLNVKFHSVAGRRIANASSLCAIQFAARALGISTKDRVR